MTKYHKTSSSSSDIAHLVMIVTPHEVKTPMRVIILNMNPQIPMFSTASGTGLQVKNSIFFQSSFNLRKLLANATIGAASKQVENMMTYPI